MSIFGTAPVFPVDPADHPGPVASGVYPAYPQSGSTATALPAADTFYAVPVLPDFAVLATRVGLRVTTGGAGSSFKPAILPADPATKLPGATALAASNTAEATTGTGQILRTLASSVLLRPGVLVWIGGVLTGTPPTVINAAAAFHLQCLLLGLGLPNSGPNAQPNGISAPLPFATNVEAANAFAGLTWSNTSGLGNANWLYGI